MNVADESFARHVQCSLNTKGVMSDEDPTRIGWIGGLSGFWPAASCRTNFQTERQLLFANARRLLVSLDLSSLIKNSGDKSAAIKCLRRALREQV